MATETPAEVTVPKRNPAFLMEFENDMELARSSGRLDILLDMWRLWFQLHGVFDR